ncbi:MAG: hypothetical protein VX017_11275 [Pseudomonadota bacterium]|nr:hypothetical protein [Pseudomonadota bacterium]
MDAPLAQRAALLARPLDVLAPAALGVLGHPPHDVLAVGDHPAPPPPAAAAAARTTAAIAAACATAACTAATNTISSG